MICYVVISCKSNERLPALLQMMSLSKQIAAKTAKPYSQPVKVTVVEVGKCNKYKTEKGEDKEVTMV